jgi:hypothetical protein
MRLRQPQICVTCIKENNYIRKAWDFGLISCCPKHSQLLTGNCDVCRKKLSWHRPRMLICRCGSDLRRTKTISASDNELIFSEWLGLRILEGDLNQSKIISTNPAINLLAELSIDGAMRILRAIGLKESQFGEIESGISRKILSTAQASICVNRALQRLADIQLHQYLPEVQSLFIKSALHEIIDDGISEADKSFASQLLCHSKRSQRNACLRNLDPLSQLNLF